jgi:large subunit ribosomal protein L16
MFRKPHCSILNYLGAQRGIQLNKGSLALICVECCKLTKHQIEAGRVAIGRILKKKRGGLQVFVNAKANIGITAKPSEVRMGKGKGDVVGMVYLAQKGLILYELKIPETMRSRGILALKYAQTKLPLRTVIIWRSRLPSPIVSLLANDSSFNSADFL